MAADTTTTVITSGVQDVDATGLIDTYAEVPAGLLEAGANFGAIEMSGHTAEASVTPSTGATATIADPFTKAHSELRYSFTNFVETDAEAIRLGFTS